MSGAITLRAFEAEWALRGALAAASKDDVTPVLTAVEWLIEGGRATLTATDRYRVHQLYVPIHGDDKADSPAEGKFLMSRRQATQLLKAIPRRDDTAMVELSWLDAEPIPAGFTGKMPRRYSGTITWEVRAEDTLIHEAEQVRGNFPPVGRLFPAEGSAEGDVAPMIGLQPELLADLRWLRSGRGSLRFVMPRVSEAAKHQPMLVVNTEGTARALIQPNLLPGAKEYGS